MGNLDALVVGVIIAPSIYSLGSFLCALLVHSEIAKANINVYVNA